MALVFFSYSHADEDLRNRLEVHLAMLMRQGVITVWHDRRLPPGDEIDRGISGQLEKADLILLVVSPDFLASRYCYDVEMARALERHRAGEARVLPVILRPCDWKNAPFGSLMATPIDGKPITKFADYDDAFLEVTNAIKAAVGSGKPQARQTHEVSPTLPMEKPLTESPVRSSNLRIRKNFTEADKDKFLDETFEYMAKFFENSLGELTIRNSDLETSFKRIDATEFTAVVYRNGAAASRCRIWLGGRLSLDGIAYSPGGTTGRGSFIESLNVYEDEEGLFIKPFMAMNRLVEKCARLTSEGASEYYWSIFIEPLQR
jgi:TIR domain